MSNKPARKRAKRITMPDDAISVLWVYPGEGVLSRDVLRIPVASEGRGMEVRFETPSGEAHLVVDLWPNGTDEGTQASMEVFKAGKPVAVLTVDGVDRDDPESQP